MRDWILEGVRAAAVVAGSLLLLVSCAPAADPAPASSPDRGTLSQRLLADPLSVGPDDGPGCAAAVGKQGTVVWHGAHGVADVKAGTPISESTIFDIGSVTKQFTATAVLLLAAEGKLGLDDRLSDHVDGLPRWSDVVTIDQLIHHTSGIPEYIALLEDKGYDPEKPLGRKRAFEALAGTTKLDSKPGTHFAYSNSNYLLLGYVIEQVTRAPIADVLTQLIFRPLGLQLTMQPTKPVTGKARSYRLGAYGTGYVIADWHWDASGAAGIQSRLTDLVQWADNYRTGKLGGQSLLHAQLAGAVATGDGNGSRYGAGILVRPDRGLVHTGGYGGFITMFRISPDREQELVVACNNGDADLEAIGDKLADLWHF